MTEDQIKLIVDAIKEQTGAIEKQTKAIYYVHAAPWMIFILVMVVAVIGAIVREMFRS